MPPNCVTVSDHIVSMGKALTNASTVKPFVELLNIGIACASWREAGDLTTVIGFLPNQ